MKSPSKFRLDILSWRPIRGILLWPAFPVALQVVSLGVVGWLVANGLGIGLEHSSADLMTLRKTNLTTLAVWGLWWPGMIALAILGGRLWCTVCPMELVNRVGDAIARRVGWPRARLGRLVRAGWIVLALYLMLQLLVAGFEVHRVPHFTATMLLLLGGLAFATGLVFRDPRSFCRGFCPAAALLSVYGRYTPLQLEIREASVCDQCAEKDCTSAQNRWRFDRRSCPSLLRPYRHEASDGCVLCLQCAKVCPHDNLGYGLVTREATMSRQSLLRPFEAGFVMVALGFVAHEVVGEVRWLDAYFHAPPHWLHAHLPGLAFGWVEALWFLLLFPLLVWGVIAGFGYVLGHRKGWRLCLLSAATGAAPVVAVAHLAKGAAKVSSWGGFLPLALRDPEGVSTFQAITVEHTLRAPIKLVALSLLGWIMLLAVLVIGFRAWRWVKEVPSESLAAARAGMLTASVIYAAVLVAWVLPGS